MSGDDRLARKTVIEWEFYDSTILLAACLPAEMAMVRFGCNSELLPYS